MSFLNASLLAGAALIAVPIILHLIMRQKPKLLEFPALRFIQKRHDRNQRRLRLRHLLLLLLRAAAIALLAFALARPSVKFSGSLGSQESPVAAALVVDAAPHMLYRQAGKTRLEAAREMGLTLLAQLPSGSQTAVLDSSLGAASFDADRGLSRRRLERMEAVNPSQPLARVVAEAVRVLAKSDLPRKEIYVFTDLSQAAWPAEAAATLQQRMTEAHDLAVYVIDVGVTDPANFALGELKLSRQVFSSGGAVDLRTEVASLGMGGQRTVELSLLSADGQPQKGPEQTVTLEPGEAQSVEFRLAALEPGTHQGIIRVRGQDGLEADDTRYFTLDVRPPWRVLVVANRPAEDESRYYIGAIAPAELRRRGQAQYETQVIDFDQFAQQDLGGYSAVCLLDPPGLEPAVWKKLTDFVAEGHGLGIFLGRRATPFDAFNTPMAQQVMPGKLEAEVPRRDGDNFIAPRDFEHPILRELASRATSTPWHIFPVFRYWNLTDLAPGVATVIPYTDGRPAVLERSAGSGRVLVMTTPISDAPGPEAWNWLPLSHVAKPWPFVILMHQMTSYLVGGSQQQLNYYAGETASLPLEGGDQKRGFVLTAPDSVKTTLAPQGKTLVVNTTERVGNYQVRSGGSRSGLDRGFSVNLAPQLTELHRVDEKQLKEMFKPIDIQLARTSDQIDRSVSAGRVGRELYPTLILVFIAVLALELIVANRFYGEEK